MVPNLRGAQFSRISRVVLQLQKLRSAKLGRIDLLYVPIFIGSMSLGAAIRLCLQWCVQTMSLLRYFSPVSADLKLPDPQGAIARDNPSSSISAANVEVKRMQSEQQIPQNRRGSCTQSSRTYKG